jgi:DNA-binding transcriptional regulator YiaG
MMRMTMTARSVETCSPSPPSDACKLPPPKLRQELRKIAGLTQEDVALEFGVSDGAVSYWERRRPGRRHLRGYLLRLIDWADAASAMGLVVDWPAAGPGLPEK